MPTCSQAKILTNLEGDTNKRFFKFSSPPNELATTNQPPIKYDTSTLFSYQENQQHNYENKKIPMLKPIDNSASSFYHPKSAAPSTSNHKYCDKFLRNFQMNNENFNQRRRVSLDEPVFNYENNHNHHRLPHQAAKLRSASGVSTTVVPILHKIPIIFGDYMQPKRDSVPINFLYNSPLRSYHRYSINQLRINSLRNQLRMNQNNSTKNNTMGSDGEEIDENNTSSSNNSSGSNSYRNNNADINKSSKNDKSYMSLPEVKHPVNSNNNKNIYMNYYYLSRRKSSTNSLSAICGTTNLSSSGGYSSQRRRTSWDFNQYLPINSRRNSIEDLKLYATSHGGGLMLIHDDNENNHPQNFYMNNFARRDSLRKYGSAHFGSLATNTHTHPPPLAHLYPSLPRNSIVDLELFTINNTVDYSSINKKMTKKCATDSNSAFHNTSTTQQESSINFNSPQNKKVSLEQAKRLLAIASIRPSKTFHKLMTEEEIDMLKKYYESIKPKGSNAQQLNGANLTDYSAQMKNAEYYPPITYESSKVSLTSLKSLKSFIDTYKKEIDSGRYTVDYDTENDPKGFVLKDQNDQSVIKFPNDVNDSMFALAITNSDREKQRLSEANLYRIVNWNDTVASCFKTNNSKSKYKQSLQMNSTSSVKASNNRKMSIESVSNKQKVKEQEGEVQRVFFDVESDSNADESQDSARSNQNVSANIMDKKDSVVSVELKELKPRKDSQSSNDLNNNIVNLTEFETSSQNSDETSDSNLINRKMKNTTSSIKFSVKNEEDKTNNSNLNDMFDDLKSETRDKISPTNHFNNNSLNRISSKNKNINSLIKYSNSTNTLHTTSNYGSPNSSTLSFEYIKNLSSLVNSIIEPKLLKQLTNSGVDLR
jgi:hypothetical protein